MNIIGVITSRYASQRLPAKPLVDLLGKTMVQRVYEQARKSRLLSRVVVATDDDRIAQAVKSFGGEYLMTSPEIKSGSDRVAAVAEMMDGDIFVNVQGDEPLIAPEMIDQGVQLLLDSRDAEVGTLAKKIESLDDLVNPNVVKVVMDQNSFALYFSRSTIPFVRDEADQKRWLQCATFYKHFGIYVYRRPFLRRYATMPEGTLEKSERLEQLRILESGAKIKVGITTFDSIPVDTKEDVDKVVEILRQSQ